MSNSNLITVRVPAHSNNYRVGRTSKLDCITPHHMAGKMTAAQCGRIFQDGTRKASTNMGIGYDVSVGLYVEEKDRSFGSSSASNDNRALTIELSNDGGASDWHVSDEVINKFIDVSVDFCRRNGLPKVVYNYTPSGSITRHNMFTATSCPGPYLESKLPEIEQRVNAILNEGQGTPQEPTRPEGTYIIYTVTRGDSLSVIGQKYGVKWQDIASANNLKSPYTIYIGQTILIPNQEGAPTPITPGVDIDQLARDVIAGKYGTGDERKAALGSNFTAVQNRVNEILKGQQNPPIKKSIDELAREVIAGKWGTGDDRKKRLANAGYDAAAVQRRVNQLL